MGNVEKSYHRGAMRSLKEEQQVRQKPSVIFGSADEYGAAHGVWEIIDNSADEAVQGYGKLITVKIERDYTVTVADMGRGVPMGWNEAEQKYDWELVFCTLYASAKYDTQYYEESSGLNGLGTASTQFASEFMDVESTYEGKTHIMHFEKGRPVGEMEVVDTPDKHTGTKVVFRPDKEVFIGIANNPLPVNYFIDKLRQKAITVPGVKFVLDHYEFGAPVEFYYERGMADFINSIDCKKLLPEALYFEGSASGFDDANNTEPYTVRMELSFNFSRTIQGLEQYHNGSFLDDRSKNLTFTALKEGFVNAVMAASRLFGKGGKLDKLAFEDIESILICVGETHCPGSRTIFKNQTKNAIRNPFIKDQYSQFVFNSVYKFFADKTKEAAHVLDEIIVNKEAREEANKVSQRVLRKLSKEVKFTDMPEGFRDCTDHNMACEIYLVEGKSAAGSVVQARFQQFQAVMPFRGKIINCLKEDIKRVLSSEVVIDMFKVFGCGIEVKGRMKESLPPFDIGKLKWDKIVICTDADVDGMQIRCLLITMFYVLAPSLLEAGKVYIVETPLYTLTAGKKVEFAYSEGEKATVIQKMVDAGIPRNKIVEERSKGLGENDVEMMNLSTMNPKYRKLVRVDYEVGSETTANLFNALLGNDLDMRKAIIEEYFSMVDSVA